MENNTHFGNKNITKLFVKFAIPCILGMLIVSLQMMIDGMFLGRQLGALGLAGVNLSMPVINFLMGVSMMICSGGSVIASIYLGKKENILAKEITTITFLLLIGVIEILSIFLFFNMEFIISLLGSNNEVYPYVKNYLTPMVLGAFLYSSPIFTETFARVLNKPNLVFFSGVIGLVVNILLDYFFIIKLQLGMSGGAYATLIACFSSFLLLIKFIKFSFPKNNIYFYLKDIKNIFYNGSSEMLSIVASTFAVYLFNRALMNTVGYIGVSALTIVFYINQLLNIVLYGLSQALQPLVSFNLGAKNLKNIYHILKIAFFFGGGVGVTVYLGCLVGSEFIIKIFAKNNLELENLTKEALSFISFAYLISFFNIVATSFFTAIEKPLESIIVSISRSLVFIAIFIGILPQFWDIKGIWLSEPFAEFSTLVISFFLLRKSKKYLMKITKNN